MSSVVSKFGGVLKFGRFAVRNFLTPVLFSTELYRDSKAFFVLSSPLEHGGYFLPPGGKLLAYLCFR